MRLGLLLWACSGGGGTEPPTDGPTAETGTATAATGDTGEGSVPTGDTAPTCAPSVELGTGELAFEAIGERIDMINGPQGGWHVVTAVRICDLGTDATLSFRAHRVSDGLEVGGSGIVQRTLIPDGDCCFVAVDVYTYLLVAGYGRPADALHEQSVDLDVEVTLPDGAVWTDATQVVFVDSTLTDDTQ